MNNKKEEGIHLYAYGKGPNDAVYRTYEDSDYSSKQAFARDLRANEIKVKAIRDNRDMYIIDNSDYGSVVQVKKELKFYKDMQKDSASPEIYTDRIEKLQKLLDEANKISLTEFKEKIINNKKLQEATRNELVAKTKAQTITRYNKAPGYKGFSIADIDTTSIFTTNSLRVTCRVGNYYDTVEMQNILYWVQLEAEKEKDNQINTKAITRAVLEAIDGMDIKVDCSCPDFIYRFAYTATKYGYKYGKPENRPAKIRNPNNYGALCKHLTSMLSNKKWLQQVTGTLMDFLENNIDKVNKFLKLEGDDILTLPNELARRNAKAANYSKLFKQAEKDSEKNEMEEKEDEKQG